MEAIIASLDAQIARVQPLIRDHLDRHPGLRAQRDLLTTIPGIGEATAAILIAELFDKRYRSARQAAALAGLVPRLVESGTLRGRSRLSKIGPGRVRNALYFPAIAALRYNPTIKATRARLHAAGNPRLSSLARRCASSFISHTVS
jgi:transposase